MQLGNLDRINVITSLFRVYSSRKFGEQYNRPLQQIYCKIKYAHSPVCPLYLMQATIEAMDDTMGGDSFVLSQFNFIIIVRFSIFSANMSLQESANRNAKNQQIKIN